MNYSLLATLALALCCGVVFSNPLYLYDLYDGKSPARSPVGDCPHKDGENPVYLPDSDDCGVFYECTNGNVSEPKSCMPGLCFDTVLNVCAWPEVDTMSAVGTCPPRDTNETIFLPDSDNCTIYYQCSNGRPIFRECAGGTEWNAELKVCDDPLNFDCENREFSIEVYSPVGTCPPRDNTTTIFLADSENCTVYYQCSNGKPYVRECAGGTEWNPSSNVCDDPLNFDCAAENRRRSPRSAVGTCPENDPANPIFLPDSEDCSLYYECSNGEAIQNNCADGLEWNNTKKTCVEPLDSDCNLSSSSSTSPPGTDSTDDTTPNATDGSPSA